MDEPALSAGAAARRLGVAVGTLRSWDRRYGIGPRDREPGGHRRYAPADLARLTELCRLVGEGVAVAEAARAVLAGVPEENQKAESESEAGTAVRSGGGRTLPVGRHGGASARGLARAAIRLDEAQVLELLEQAIARDGVVTAWQRTIEPALRAVGRKWTETGGQYVEVEHLLSWCATVALHRAGPPAPARTGLSGRAVLSGRVVLLACAPHEWHSLPLEVLAGDLALRGVPTVMLGAAVPRDALREAVRRIGPACVLIWSHSSDTADAAVLTGLSHPRGTQIMAAGPGWLGCRPFGVRVVTVLEDAIEACVETRNGAPRAAAGTAAPGTPV